MAQIALLLNPKAIKLYVEGEWDAAGRPLPLLMVMRESDRVTVIDPIDPRRKIGSGYLGGNVAETESDGAMSRVNTGDGINRADRGKGYGLALYCGLALSSAVDGIYTDGASAEATELWMKMVGEGLAEEQAGGERSGDTEFCYETDGSETVNDFPSDDIEARVISGQSVCGDVEVEYDVEDIKFLSKRSVRRSNLVLAERLSTDDYRNFDTSQQIAAAIDLGKIPPDLFSVLPLRGPAEVRLLTSVLQKSARGALALRRLLSRPDVADPSGQTRIPTGFIRRVADTGPSQGILGRRIKTEEFLPEPIQQPLFGLGRRRRGGGLGGLSSLGNIPVPVSADLRRFLDKYDFGD